MPAADEERDKRRGRSGSAFNEMHITIAVAVVIALGCFAAYNHVNTKMASDQQTQRMKVRRTRAPISDRVYAGTSDEQSLPSPPPQALQEILAEESDFEDPMLAVGPTAIPPPEGPPASPLPPPQLPPPPPPGNRVPWPLGNGNQPPTPNPYLNDMFPPSYAPTIAQLNVERKNHAAEVAAKFGSYPSRDKNTLKIPIGPIWILNPKAKDPSLTEAERHAVEPPYGGHSVDSYVRKHSADHTWDNRSNWLVSRTEFCTKQNLKKAKLLPAKSSLSWYADLEKLNAPDFQGLPSGKPRGELPFDPAVVRDKFFQAQAALAEYAEGTKGWTGSTGVHPIPTAEQYLPYIENLAKRFAAEFIRSGRIVIGALGDSTLAGADNSFYDNWLLALQRDLKPLFAAGKVTIETRNAGHNGGYGASPQLSCFSSMIGEDVDIAIASFPFVRPRPSLLLNYELFIRRAMASGILPHVGTPGESLNELVEAYSPLGVGFGPERFEGLGATWYPNVKNAGWGMISDGLCHIQPTRSHSNAVLYRNWHPGPLGHHIFADRIAFQYISAATQALTMIEEDLKASGGKLAPLLKKYPGRSAVKAMVKSWPTRPLSCKQCESIEDVIKTDKVWRMYVEWMQKEFPKRKSPTTFPHCQSLCGQDTFDKRFPFCLTQLAPTFGHSLSEFNVAEKSSASFSNPKFPNSMPHKAKDYTPVNGSWKSIGVWEYSHPGDSPVHQDYKRATIMGDGPVVLRVPRNSASAGIVSACVHCTGRDVFDEGAHKKSGISYSDSAFAPTVSVQSGANGKLEKQTLTWADDQDGYEFDDFNCFTLKKRIPTNEDVSVHIDCTEPAKKHGKVGTTGVIDYFAVL